VLHSNGLPVFVDVDPKTYNIDPTKIEERITHRTKAVMAVDLHGLPADYEQIEAVAKRHDVLVIEDASQAVGSTYQDRQVGSLGDMAGCSMGGSKNLSALGEGGLFSTDSDRYCELAQRVRMFGELVEPGEARQYNAYIMGWNYRHDPLQSAFARSQLKRLPHITKVRIENGAFLTEHLQEIPGVLPPYVPEDRTHTYFFYPILVQPEELGADLPVEPFRLGLQEVLTAEGVPIRPWQTRPVPAQSLFQFKDGYGRGCPWTCPYADHDIEYDLHDYPVAMDVTRRRLVLGHCIDAFGPPNGLALMARYAEAFHKVLVEHRDELIAHVRARTTETQATMGEMPQVDYSG
jgi:dTDP-4-amino-4,6-dideoxygalactose transaminase